MNYFSVVLFNWKEFFKLKQFRLRVFITIPLLVTILISITNFLTFNEFRRGVIIHDPIINYINPIDLSLITFSLTYLSVLFGTLLLLTKPKLTLITLNSYMMILIFRMITMYLLPLEPPVEIIPLRDIILESSFYSGRINLKDLFFSGHTASVFLFFLVFNNKWIKAIFIISTIFIASCLVIQHVHYSIDIIVAPIFAWISFKMAQKLYLF
ncbi:MAG: hypothetical protein COX07_02545, partial [Bacteroidetes bacterium CG23_combo_of_CG06-09_8_20_14_all_32_9]